MPQPFAALLNTFGALRRVRPEQDILGRFGEAFVPRGEGRNRKSYYDEATSNEYLKTASEYAGGMHPLAGWLANGLGAGLIAGVTSANPIIGLATGGASLITGIPSLVSDMFDRKARQERAERLKKQREAIFNASAGVGELKNQYTSFTKALQDLRNDVNKLNSNSELAIERAGEGKAVKESIDNAQMVTEPVKGLNNLQIQRAASFSFFPTLPVARRRTTTRPATPDRRVVRPMVSNFFTIL